MNLSEKNKIVSEFKKRDLEFEFVSHYTSIDTFIERINPEYRIRFNTLNKTNDPFEYRKALDFISWEGNLEDTEMTKAFDQANDLIYKNLKVLCCTQAKEIDKERYFEINALITECSFGNVSMWAHYGGNQKGLCIVLNRLKLQKKLEKKFSSIFINNIIYTNLNRERINKPHFTDSNTQKELEKYYLEENLKNFFFKKEEDWKTEREVRFMIFNKEEEGPEFVDILDCIEAIIIGEKAEPIYNDIFKWILNDKGIRLFRIDWDFSTSNTFQLKLLNNF